MYLMHVLVTFAFPCMRSKTNNVKTIKQWPFRNTSVPSVHGSFCQYFHRSTSVMKWMI